MRHVIIAFTERPADSETGVWHKRLYNDVRRQCFGV